MMEKADTMFLLLSAVAMLLMIPALEIICNRFGVRRRSTEGQAWAGLGAVMMIWLLFGFFLPYGTGNAGLLGGNAQLLQEKISGSPTASYGDTIPPLVLFLQPAAMGCIAVSLVALPAGFHRKAHLLFVVLWSIFCYMPLAHSVWDGGLLAQIGFLDYGGGAVIHICAGASALAVGLFLKRKEFAGTLSAEEEKGGLALAFLWAGWIFCYSSRGIGEESVFFCAAGNAVISAAAGMLVWYVLDMLRNREEGFLSVQRGCLSALAGIAAGAAYVTPLFAAVLGASSAAICYAYMDMQDFFPAAGGREIWIPHGIGGLAGTILFSIFADPALCAMPYARGKQCIVQAGAAYAVIAGVFVVTWLILLCISRVFPLYLAEEEEERITRRILEERKKLFGEAKKNGKRF